MNPLSFKAGAATTCITPDDSLWLAGYASRTAPSRGNISDLFASALALEDATGQRFLIATIDLIAVTPIIAAPVAAAALATHGVVPSQLLLAPTHTHYGPEFRPDKSIFFAIPDAYAAKVPAVATRIAAAITQTIDNALAGLEPVRLFARQSAATFAHNRRRRGTRDGNPSSDDVVDHDVPILDCVDARGNRKAIVFGYACHNTTIPADDLRYCGDWAGFAKEQLQQTYPGSTAFFIPGAGADQDPEPSGSVELSRQYGCELASAVEESLASPGIEIAGTIRAVREDVELRLEPMTIEGLDRMLASDDPPQRVKAQFLFDQLEHGEKLITSYSAPIQVVRFGNELMMIALGGEPVVDWAHRLTSRAASNEAAGRIPAPGSPPHIPRPLIWVAGYCNDMFGYVPTRRVQAEGGYEAGRANLWSWIPAPFTNDVEDRISAAVQRLVERTRPVDEPQIKVS